jgi:hypothetical protein
MTIGDVNEQDCYFQLVMFMDRRYCFGDVNELGYCFGDVNERFIFSDVHKIVK